MNAKSVVLKNAVLSWRTRHRAQRLVTRSAEEFTKPEGSPGMSSEDARYILDTFDQQDTASKLCKPPCDTALRAAEL